MKNLVFAFALLCSSSLLAQFSYNSTNPTGIESNTNNASGNWSFAVGGGTQASGPHSTAMGILTIASGDNSTAMGDNTEASGQQSTAMGWQTTASGSRAIALGGESIASGSHSTAMGYQTTASGDYSTAMGEITNAFGDSSTAMGALTTASGVVSTAMGLQTEASGTFSTAIGYDTTASGFVSTAMGLQTEASGPQSTAMGTGTIASGNLSTAMGWNTNAQDFGATAIGTNSKIDESPNPSEFSLQNTAFIIGNGDSFNNRSNAFEVLFDGSTTIAGNVTAPAFIGDGSQLTNMPLSFNATSGNGIESATNTASGNHSTAMGVSTTASGATSTAMGYITEASAFHSTAMGLYTKAQDFATTSIGCYNKTDETTNSTSFSYQNTAFVIGNGGFDNEGNWLGGTDESRSNAFEVLFDGSTTIAGDLNINSDARLKANIISLGATLSKLLQIDGKTYTMKKDTNHKKKIGLLAQDIEKVFPELVTETNDIKSVNYQGLVPVLINAMKEQQDEIERLKKQETKLNKQQQEIDELKAMVKALAKG